MMKKIIFSLLCVGIISLSGCATGSHLQIEYPTPNGIMIVEANGDTLVTYNKETGDIDFVTEQIKAEQADLLAKYMEAILTMMGK